VPLMIGCSPTLDAEYMCVGAIDTDEIGIVVAIVGIAVLVGESPEMLIGKHCEGRGTVVPNSLSDQDGVVESPSLASMSRSTSISRLLLSLMPVVEELPVQTPLWSVIGFQLGGRLETDGDVYLLYSAARVTSTSGNLTVISISAVPILSNDTPKASFGYEYAPKVIDADISLTSKSGVIEPPPKPVAELEPGFLISATSCALLGIPAESPKSTVAVP